MKYITVTEHNQEELINKFKDYLKTAKLSSEYITFSTKLTRELPNLPKAQLYITTEAYLKILLYVRDTATEIAWHGTVNREGNRFLIKDVMLYPQTLSAATVTTDQEKYNEWLINIDDETHNKLRFQGHSHVNFSPTPSGTDLTYYNDILQVLPKDDYYIFMIINKSGAMTLLIYDLAANIIYENEDIEFTVLNSTNDIDLEHHINYEKEKYCTKPVYTPTQQLGSTIWTNSLNSYDYDYDYENVYDSYPSYRNSKIKTKKGKK